MDSLTLNFSDTWFAWGIALIIAFPFSVIVIGELIHQLEQRQSQWVSLLRQLQRFVIPLLITLLIMTHVLELDSEHIAVKVVATLFWILVIYTAISFINLSLFSDSDNASWKIKAPKLLLDFARIIVIAVGSAMVLSYVWGFELAKMLAALGVGSIVLGLALQDTLSSLVAGFSLVSSKQFRVGDWLQVGDDIGKIIDINWRTVTLINRDEDVVIIPNGDLAKTKFINFTYPYPRHVEHISFDFSFDDAPYKVKSALYEAAIETPGILHDPKPVIDLISYDEFSVKHEIKFFIADYKDLPRIKNQFISSVWYIAKRKGLTFPTRAHEVFLQKDTSSSENELVEERKLQVLLQSPLLKGKDRNLLEKIAKFSHIYTYGEGEAIVKQGKNSEEFFIMLEGHALESYQDENGKIHRIQEIEKGDFFGLISLISDEADNVSVITHCDCDVLAVDENSTRELLRKYPEVASKIERLIERQQAELESIRETLSKTKEVLIKS